MTSKIIRPSNLIMQFDELSFKTQIILTYLNDLKSLQLHF